MLHHHVNRERKDIACLMLPSCMTRTRVLLPVSIKVSALQLIAEAVKCKSDRCGTRVQGFDISVEDGLYAVY
jgi:hypothetical protein